jgi:putative phosphoribosyl transferase
MPMYFESRAQAGKLLAEEIAKDYAGKPCAIVALSEGGVVVGAQIALKLHAVLTLLLVEPIDLPNEPEPIASISETGNFSYNSLYSAGQIEELMSEFRGVVEDEKRTQLSHMHQLLGAGSGIRKDLLHDKNVILVSDGFSTGYSLDIAMEFLKPQIIRDLVIVAPVASPTAIDRMHVLGGKTYCLNMANTYLDTEHYYANHDVPEREEVVKIVEEIMQAWR